MATSRPPAPPPVQADARRRNAGRIWSWLAIGCGAVGLGVYFLSLAFMSRHPDPGAGQIYAVIALVRYEFGFFRYATLEQAVTAYGGLVFAGASYAAWLLLLRRFDPAAFRKRWRSGKI